MSANLTPEMQKAPEIVAPSALGSSSGMGLDSNNHGKNNTMDHGKSRLEVAVEAYRAEQEAIARARAAIHDAYHEDDDMSFGKIANALGITKRAVATRIQTEERRRAQGE